MKKYFATILVMMMFLSLAIACDSSDDHDGGPVSAEKTIEKAPYIMYAHGKKYNRKENAREFDEAVQMVIDEAINTNIASESVTTTDYGTLEATLGDKAMTVTDLEINGPIDLTDFNFMKKCAQQGNVRCLILFNADIKNKKIPDEAFYEQIDGVCPVLMPIARVFLPDDVLEIGEKAFASMVMVEVHLPENLRKLDDDCFRYSSYLRGSLSIPDGVTEIPDHAFFGSGISKLEIPAGVTEIDALSFANNENLQTITCHAAYPPLSADRNEHGETVYAFGDRLHRGTPRDISVYIPKGSKARYADSKSGWQWFSNFVEME